MTEEQSNVLWIAELYSRARQLEMQSERVFLPCIDPPELRDFCESGGRLLYLFRKHAPAVWGSRLKDFAELQFTDDFERDWEETKWSNVMYLWGHAIDIENHLIDEGDLKDFFRERLANLTTPGGFILRKYEYAEWHKATRDWVEWFFDRSLQLVRRVCSSLREELKQVDVIKNPMARLVLIEYALLEFEHQFLVRAAAIGPYLPRDVDNRFDRQPWIWDDGTVDVELGSEAGILRTELFPPSVRCFFAPIRNQVPSAPIKWVLEGCDLDYYPRLYKRLVFETWDYTTGEYLDKWCSFDRRAYWFMEEPEAMNDYASGVEHQTLQLFATKDYEQLAKSIIKVVRNGRPEWRAGKVEWSYVKELDEMIILLRDTRKICEVKQGRTTVDALTGYDRNKGTSRIPQQDKSPPLSLKELAGYFGHNTTQRKIGTMIKGGHIRAKKITRESYYFDLTTLPGYVREEIQKNNRRKSPTDTKSARNPGKLAQT